MIHCLLFYNFEVALRSLCTSLNAIMTHYNAMICADYVNFVHFQAVTFDTNFATAQTTFARWSLCIDVARLHWQKKIRFKDI